MPHIVLETTSNVPENSSLPEILQSLIEELASHETVSAASVKAYHTLRPVWAMGAGAATGFVHCEIRLLTGRSTHVRKEIADGIYAVLEAAFSESVLSGESGLTVEVREMEAATYRKSAIMESER